MDQKKNSLFIGLRMQLSSTLCHEESSLRLYNHEPVFKKIWATKLYLLGLGTLSLRNSHKKEVCDIPGTPGDSKEKPPCRSKALNQDAWCFHVYCTLINSS